MFMHRGLATNKLNNNSQRKSEQQQKKKNKTYLLKNTSTYLQYRLALLLRHVFALPNDSNSGIDSNICSVMMLLGDLLIAAKYCNNSLVSSVLPDPLSPLK